VDSFVVAGIVFACTFGGVLLGMLLRRMLPEHHVCSETKDAMKLGAGLLATLSGMVLGLLIASAKSSFDTQTTGFKQMAMNIALLDRALTLYDKEETKETRQLLRQAVAKLVETRWPTNGARPSNLDDPAITATNEALFVSIQKLSPKTDTQKGIQSQAFQITAELGRTRWQLVHSATSSLPFPFLVVLVFWLTVLFTIFGMLSARTVPAIVVLLVCSLSIAGALFLIVELDNPFSGLIQIPGAPLQNALANLGA
jgi:hypothetical protein